MLSEGFNPSLGDGTLGNREVVTDKLEFRSIQLSDMPEVSRILGYWFQDYQESQGITPDPTELEEYLNLLYTATEDTETHSYFVATEPGKAEAVGLFGYSRDLDDTLRDYKEVVAPSQQAVHFRFFFMDPQYVGKGYGRQFWDHTVAAAREEGAEVGFLYSHERFQKTAWRFYDGLESCTVLDTLTMHNQECRVYKVGLDNIE